MPNSLVTALCLFLAVLATSLLIMMGCDAVADAQQPAIPPPVTERRVPPRADEADPPIVVRTPLIRALLGALDEVGRNNEIEDRDALQRSLIAADRELSQTLGRRNYQRAMARVNQRPSRGQLQQPVVRKPLPPTGPPKALPPEAAGAAPHTPLAPPSKAVEALLATLEAADASPEAKQKLREAILSAGVHIDGTTPAVD